jgi:hypothetical protein
MAQEATPAVPGKSGHATEMLFVQSFRAGAIAPKEGVDGRYTLTLEGGHGQTIYFSDRPDRVVGADPTPAFLEGLGFLPDNPPNAALVFEAAPGDTDVAVIELFSPVYDPVTHGVTYEVEVLQNWQAELEEGLQEAPTDLASVASSFGTANLFIDGCPNLDVKCLRGDNEIGRFRDQEMCWNYSVCIPCEPFGHVQPDRCQTLDYWRGKCNAQYPNACAGACDIGISWLFATSICIE